MMKRTVASTLLCLWLLVPGVVRAESRAFDFSRPARSARLLSTRAPEARRTRGWAEAGRVRAFTPASVTVTTHEVDIPTHLWLVPLILPGAGLVSGVVLCGMAGADERNKDCQTAMLVGLGLGATLGLGYLVVAACIESEGGCSEACSEDDEECLEEEDAEDWKRSRARAALRGARQAARRSPLALPLGLAPSVGVVNDRAVFGLGGRF